LMLLAIIKERQIHYPGTQWKKWIKKNKMEVQLFCTNGEKCQ